MQEVGSGVFAVRDKVAAPAHRGHRFHGASPHFGLSVRPRPGPSCARLGPWDSDDHGRSIDTRFGVARRGHGLDDGLEFLANVGLDRGGLGLPRGPKHP
eukprot:9032369-Lingulodinium_polyedra.AAC.1